MTWPFRISARERLLIIRQAKYDERNIRPVWFHVFAKEDSPEDNVYQETLKHHRKYAGPFPAYLYVESSTETEAEGPGVGHGRPLTLTISRAETYRLGQVLQEREDFDWDEDRYIPRAQDIIQWRDDLYELQDTAQPKEFWGSTGIETTYEIPATKWIMDSIASGSPLVIQQEQPPLVYPKDFYRAFADGDGSDSPALGEGRE